jgi:hypothetical protein
LGGRFAPEQVADLVRNTHPKWNIKVAGRGGRRYLPFVFTEQGVAMRSSVLRSKRAVQFNIEIMHAFVRLSLNPVNDLNGAQRLNDWNDWNGLSGLWRTRRNGKSAFW